MNNKMQPLESAQKAREHGCCSHQSLKTGWSIHPEFCGVQENVSCLVFRHTPIYWIDHPPHAQPVLAKLSSRENFAGPLRPSRRNLIHAHRRSIVINNLQELFKTDDHSVVVFIYCNYKVQYNVAQLLEALLKQLAFRRLTSDSIESLQNKHKELGRRPSLDTLTTVLKTEIQTYSRLFIVVDALDECFPEQVREDLLDKLRSLTTIAPVKLMVTSRHIPSIECAIHADIKLEIIATESDIKTHVEGRISKDNMLKRLITRAPSMEEKVVGIVVEKARGMYAGRSGISFVIVLMTLIGSS